MKPTHCIVSLTLFLFACVDKPETKQELSQIDWLVGYWQRTNAREGVAAHERWEKTSDSSLTGWGVAMRDGDTTFIEMLRIIVKDDTLHYVAEVAENPEPVYFKFTSITPNGFVCENPLHDFPKKIEYQLNNDTLTATTSGDGQKFAFKFVKRIQ